MEIILLCFFTSIFVTSGSVRNDLETKCKKQNSKTEYCQKAYPEVKTKEKDF